MNGAEKSLRAMVDKWLSPHPGAAIRVTRFTRASSLCRCYVSVRAASPAGDIAMFFFRHADGAWYIFPPGEVRPAMNALRYAA